MNNRFNSKALARAAEHNGQENLVIYASKKLLVLTKSYPSSLRTSPASFKLQ